MTRYAERFSRLKDSYREGSFNAQEYHERLCEMILECILEIGEENEKILEAKASQERLDEFAIKYLTPMVTLKREVE